MKNSPLANWHIQADAKMADFGGWLMPIEYPITGVIAEYNNVRQRVGIFDVSHLGKISVKGEGALEYMNQMITNDLKRIKSGQAQYNLICNEDGGVVDDLIIYQNSDSDLFLIPNASNNQAVFQILASFAPAGVEVKNIHQEYGVLALQGPDCLKVLSLLEIENTLDYMQFSKAQIDGCPITLCRTGYTGEMGFEIIPRWADTEKVWRKLMVIVEKLNGSACGLGARDILRTEMGYPLHGHELSLEITPVQAGATWAVGWSKSKYLGKAILDQERVVAPALKIKAIAALGRGIPRKDMQVTDANGKSIGRVTSGTFSPQLKKGIGLALIAAEAKLGDQILIDIRGVASPFQVVALPFIPSKVK